MRKEIILLSLFFSILILTDLALVANTMVKVEYKITVTQKTLIPFDNELINGTYSGSVNGYKWELTSAVYDPVNGLVYATNCPQNEVVIFDPKNDSIIGNITVGKEPVWITVNPKNGYLYVINEGSATISVINPSTNKVINAIYIGDCPSLAVYDPNNGYLYVANYLLSNFTYIVQLVNNQGVVTSIPLNHSHITSIVYDPINNRIVVGTNCGVYAISGDKIVASNNSYYYNKSIYTGNYICTLGVNPTNGDIYGVTDHAVIVYNPYNLNMTGAVPFSITRAYAAVYVNGTVYVLSRYHVYAVNVAKNTSKVFFSIPVIKISSIAGISLTFCDMIYADGELILVGDTPTPIYLVNPQTGENLGIGVDIEDPAILYDPVTGYVYMADECSNSLYVINPNTEKVVKIIPSVLQPSTLAYNPYNGYLYAASYYNYTLAEIDPYNGKVVWSVVAGKEPNAILFDTKNDLLYVEYYGSYIVAVINPNTGKVLDEVQVGSDPVSLTYNPNNGLVYVANCGSDSITVINGTQVVKTIKLGFNPTALAFINDSLYIGGATISSTSYCAPHISVYRDGKIIDNISINAMPIDIEYYNGLDYVTECGSFSSSPGYLAIINGTKVIKTVGVGVDPSSLTITPNGTIYVTNNEQGTVSIINLSIKRIVIPIITTTTKTTTTTSTTSTTTTKITVPPITVTTTTAKPSIPLALIIVIAVVVVAVVAGVLVALKK